MGGGAVVWAEAPDEDGGDATQPDEPGEVDDSFAARRLRRWLKGMFGGQPAAERPAPDSGPGEGAPGEPEGSPGERESD
jgi:hypothetical protein